MTMEWRTAMRLLRAIGLALALLGSAPAVAQGPALQPAHEVGQAPVNAGPIAPAPSRLNAADLEAWLDGFLPYALERGRIAGAVVVVVQNGRPLLQKGYGFADVASRRPVDPQTTLFRPGSVSKLFTWTAVMQQVEAGKLDLDRDVNAYLDFRIPPFDGKPITLRHILTHTAGFEESIRHLISSDPSAVMPLREYARNALPERVFAAGTTPAYSNYATALAGYIVERVSGMSFDDYVDRRIFQPLGMARSTFRQPLPARLRPLMSGGYATVGSKAQPFEIVIPAPAGSLSSTGADMGRFMITHLAGGRGLLQPQTARLMHNHRAPGIGPLNRMALGFYESQINGRRLIGHGGDTTLFHSDMALLPSESVGLYISMNSDGREGAPQAVRSALVDKFMDRYFPDARTFRPIDAATARRHAEVMAGTYVSSRGAFTNFLSILGLLGPVQVGVGADGKLSIPSLEGLTAGVQDWEEVAPYVWRDRNTGERLAAEVRNGEVIRFSVDTLSPFTVMTPAPAGANPAWINPALLFALAMALIAAVAWPVRALVRRNFKAGSALAGRPLLAYRLSRGFAWAVLAAVAGWIGLIAAFSADVGAIGGPLDWLIHLLRVLSPIAALGLLATSAWLLWLAFRDRRRWAAKLGAALLLLAGLVLTYVVLRFHLYGFGMVY